MVKGACGPPTCRIGDSHSMHDALLRKALVRCFCGFELFFRHLIMWVTNQRCFQEGKPLFRLAGSGSGDGEMASIASWQLGRADATTVEAAAANEALRLDESGDDFLFYMHQVAPSRPGDCTMVGDFSPQYFSSPGAPERIRANVPDARVVILLRDPVKRVLSRFSHKAASELKKHGEVRVTNEAFHDVVKTQHRFVQTCNNLFGLFGPGKDGLEVPTQPLARPPPAAREHPLAWAKCLKLSSGGGPSKVMALSLYSAAMPRWFASFPRDQVLVLSSENVWANPRAASNAIFAFLGMPPHEIPEEVLRTAVRPAFGHIDEKYRDYHFPCSDKVVKALTVALATEREWFDRFLESSEIVLF